MDFTGGSDGKKSACNAGGWVWSLGREDSLEKRMASHSSILASRIPWTEEPGCLQSTGPQRIRHDWATNSFTLFFFFFSLQEGNGNPLQYFCLENSMDEGAWWVTVHGVTKSQTRLSNFMMMALLNAPHACVFSCGWLLATPWMIACEAPLSMEFPLQERWSSCHSQLQGIFPMEGSNPHVQSLLYCRQIP